MNIKVGQKWKSIDHGFVVNTLSIDKDNWVLYEHEIAFPERAKQWTDIKTYKTRDNMSLLRFECLFTCLNDTGV